MRHILLIADNMTDGIAVAAGTVAEWDTVGLLVGNPSMSRLADVVVDLEEQSPP